MTKSLFKSILGLGLWLSCQFALAVVNVNQADADAIAKELNGVGKVRAAAIVSERDKNGPFKDGQDLAKRVKGIGARTIANNTENLQFK